MSAAYFNNLGISGTTYGVNSQVADFLKKKKALITFYFSVLRNLQKHQREQLSSKPQNAVQSSSFWLHNVEEIKAIEHF